MDMQPILQKLFNRSSLQEVALSELQELTEQYPYFAAGHFLLTKKMQEENHSGFEAQLQKTTLYFNNTLWLQYLLEDHLENSNDGEEVIQTKPLSIELTNKESGDELFTPYHTVDYFASQGIKPSQEPKPDDKLGRQLKSFTEWLKTMRRLPGAAAVQEVLEKETGDQNAIIEKIAAHSLEEKEVVTEAMAEVLLMQGKKDKAAGVYHKLSLLNPDKRAYFAAKIDELNA